MVLASGLILILSGVIGIFVFFLLLLIGLVLYLGIVAFCVFLLFAGPIYIFLLIWKEPSVPWIRLGRFRFPP